MCRSLGDSAQNAEAGELRRALATASTNVGVQLSRMNRVGGFGEEKGVVRVGVFGSGDGGKVDRRAEVAGEEHFRQGDGKAAFGEIMGAADKAVLNKVGDSAENSGGGGEIHARNVGTDLVMEPRSSGCHRVRGG